MYLDCLLSAAPLWEPRQNDSLRDTEPPLSDDIEKMVGRRLRAEVSDNAGYRPIDLP